MKQSTPIRVRSDLAFYERPGHRQSQWVIKDPIAFSHFLFSEQEAYLLRLFDGSRSLEEIRLAWQTQFCTKSLTIKQVEAFAERLIRDNLVVVERAGSGVRYFDRRRSAARQQRLQKWVSPLVIKLGGIDPTGLLNFLWLPGKLLFHPIVVGCCLFFSCLVFGYFVTHTDDIVRQLPTASQFFAPKNLLLMIAIMAVVKVLHEFGHALACRKYGGECFEIGVILLVLIPTLYCDVSDSWTFRHRWKRIMVVFAGIFVEILLATCCALLWLLTEPGFIHSVAFNVTVMCSLNTLLVNGNPLLKYDGYYIVSDLFGQPNLAQRSRLNYQVFINSLFRDVEEPQQWSGWLSVFGGMSAAYRWLVMISIVAGVYTIVQGLELGFLDELVALFLVGTVGFRMVSQQRAQRRMIRGRVNAYRSAATVLFIAVLAFLFCWMPLPTGVYCQFEVQSREPSVVYAPQDGRLNTLIASETHVQTGEPIVSVWNRKRDFEQAQAASRLEHLQEKLQRLERQLDNQGRVVTELMGVRNEIEKQHSELELLKKEAEAFEIKATRSGVVRTLVSYKSEHGGRATETAFAPMMPENNECFVRRGQPLFSILTSERKLVAVVGEQSVEFLQEGQPVFLRFNQSAGPAFSGKLEKIAEVDVDLSDNQTERMGLETTIDDAGNLSLVETPYRLIISSESLPPEALIGSAGHARIVVPSQTAAQKVAQLIDSWWNQRY